MEFMCEGCGEVKLHYAAMTDDVKLCERCAFYSDIEVSVWDTMTRYMPNAPRVRFTAQVQMLHAVRKGISA